MKKIIIICLLFILSTFISIESFAYRNQIYVGDLFLHNNDTTNYNVYGNEIYTAYIELTYSSEDYLDLQHGDNTHLNLNVEVFNDINGNEFDDHYISEYAPLIILIDFDNLNFFIEKITNLSNDYILNKTVFTEYMSIERLAPIDDCMDGDCLGGGGGGTTPPDPNNLGAVAATNGNINLDNKVGFIDTLTPYFSDSYISDMNWKTETPYNETTGQHATNVLKTFKDSYPNITEYAIYSSKASYAYQVMNAISWMISNDVHLINMSFGLDIQDTYNTITKSLDYICEQNDILIIAADTNVPNEISTTNVSYPGLGYNSLCVGALDDLSYDILNPISGYNEVFAISKPNLVDEYQTIHSSLPGTSFSAPRVTAKISKMLFNNQELKDNLPLLLSLIHTNSTIENIDINQIDFDNSGFDDKLGTGLLDFSNNVYVNGNYYYTNSFTNSYYPITIYQKEFPDDISGTISFTTAVLAVVDKTDLVYSFIGYPNIECFIYINDVFYNKLEGNNILHSEINLIAGDILKILVRDAGNYDIYFYQYNFPYDIAISWRLL